MAKTATEKQKVKPICDECGSEGVTFDATAEWDEENQRYEIANTFDQASCGDCEGECDVYWIPVDADPKEFMSTRFPFVKDGEVSGRTYTVIERKKGYGGATYQVKRDDGESFGNFGTKLDASLHAEEMTNGKDLSIERRNA